MSELSAEREFELLEAALVRAGRARVYPAAPHLAARVRAALEAETPRRRAALWFAPRWAWSLLVALVLALGLLLALPQTRNAIAQWLGLRSLQIIVVTPTPAPTLAPTPSAQQTPRPTATPTSVPTPRAQCCETTLADAQARARFKILLPPDQIPSRVYLQNVFGGDMQQLIMNFGDARAPTFTLYQAHQVIYQKVVGFGKEVTGGTLIEETTVRGTRALWLTGAPHVLVYLDTGGQPLLESQRTVDSNTLAWEDTINLVTYRLETKLSKAEALRFAESLR